MLVLSNLHDLLTQVLELPDLHTAALLTPEGQLVSYAIGPTRCKDDVLVLVGLSGEIWQETGEQGIGMAESDVCQFHFDTCGTRSKAVDSSERSSSALWRVKRSEARGNPKKNLSCSWLCMLLLQLNGRISKTRYGSRISPASYDMYLTQIPLLHEGESDDQPPRPPY